MLLHLECHQWSSQNREQLWVCASVHNQHIAEDCNRDWSQTPHLPWSLLKIKTRNSYIHTCSILQDQTTKDWNQCVRYQDVNTLKFKFEMCKEKGNISSIEKKKKMGLVDWTMIRLLSVAQMLWCPWLVLVPRTEFCLMMECFLCLEVEWIGTRNAYNYKTEPFQLCVKVESDGRNSFTGINTKNVYVNEIEP